MDGLDWSVVVLYFALVLGLAWWVILQQKNTAADYFLAGRHLGWFVIGASIFASNIGSEHLVGLAGSGATDGVAMAHFELHAWCLLVLAWVMTAPTPGATWMQREPTAISLVAMATPSMPVRSHLPMSEKVVNSMPGVSMITSDRARKESVTSATSEDRR